MGIDFSIYPGLHWTRSPFIDRFFFFLGMAIVASQMLISWNLFITWTKHFRNKTRYILRKQPVEQTLKLKALIIDF